MCKNNKDIKPDQPKWEIAVESGGLADRLLAIGKECADHLKEPWRSVEHDDLLYDERGLPHSMGTRP